MYASAQHAHAGQHALPSYPGAYSYGGGFTQPPPHALGRVPPQSHLGGSAARAGAHADRGGYEYDGAAGWVQGPNRADSRQSWQQQREIYALPLTVGGEHSHAHAQYTSAGRHIEHFGEQSFASARGAAAGDYLPREERDGSRGRGDLPIGLFSPADDAALPAGQLVDDGSAHARSAHELVWDAAFLQAQNPFVAAAALAAAAAATGTPLWSGGASGEPKLAPVARTGASPQPSSGLSDATTATAASPKSERSSRSGSFDHAGVAFVTPAGQAIEFLCTAVNVEHAPVFPAALLDGKA
jgi:hypothetical protein